MLYGNYCQFIFHFCNDLTIMSSHIDQLKSFVMLALHNCKNLDEMTAVGLDKWNLIKYLFFIIRKEN